MPVGEPGEPGGEPGERRGGKEKRSHVALRCAAFLGEGVNSLSWSKGGAESWAERKEISSRFAASLKA